MVLLYLRREMGEEYVPLWCCSILGERWERSMCLMVLLYLRREMGEEYVPYGAALS